MRWTSTRIAWTWKVAASSRGASWRTWPSWSRRTVPSSRCWWLRKAWKKSKFGETSWTQNQNSLSLTDYGRKYIDKPPSNSSRHKIIKCLQTKSRERAPPPAAIQHATYAESHSFDQFERKYTSNCLRKKKCCYGLFDIFIRNFVVLLYSLLLPNEWTN